jgi:NADH:ubiquinone oxidoreductase subunit E
LSLQVTRCEGTCALAPLVRVGGVMLAYTSPDEVIQHLQEVER